MKNLPPIYVISYKNPSRKSRMLERFKKLEISPIFPKEVGVEEQDIPENTANKIAYSLMLKHLDNIREFYENSDLPHCIVCEDDIHISKTFKTDIMLSF